MKRGDLHWVNLEPANPPEFGKVRPAVVVSNTEQNYILSSVVVLPISSRPPHLWPLRLELPRSANINKPSFVVVPGIRQVAKARLLGRIGATPDAFLNELQEALFAYLGA